ncbi:hypothetical protein V6N13_088072 [Hibiscus sabdariffa]
MFFVPERSIMQRQLRVGNRNDVGFERCPDDLLIQILNRVPTERLWWRCRLVCKRWNALISSPSFAQSYLQQSPPTFFVFFRLLDQWRDQMDFFLPQDDGDDKAALFIKRAFNGSLVARWKHQMRTRARAVVPVASCNGLILFKPCMYSRAKVEFYIGNLITGELITMKHRYVRGYFCGFFYHPSRQEYKLLHCHRTDSTGNPFECEYTILTLGSTRWRTLRSLPCGVRQGSPPVILDDTLYWMTEDLYFNCPYTTCENSITTFSIHSEEFHTMSHPSIESEPIQCHRRLTLLAMDGRLTCWYFSGQVVHAWVSEVPGNWTSIYNLDFNGNFGSYISPRDGPGDNYNVRPVRIQDEKLTLVWPRTGVFRYDLLKNTVEKIELEGIFKLHYREGDLLLVTCYTKSLISLSNFYPGLSEIVVR